MQIYSGIKTKRNAGHPTYIARIFQYFKDELRMYREIFQQIPGLHVEGNVELS